MKYLSKKSNGRKMNRRSSFSISKCIRMILRNRSFIRSVVRCRDDVRHRCEIGNAIHSKCLRICSDYLLLLRQFRPRAAAKRARDREIHYGTNGFSLEPTRHTELFCQLEFYLNSRTSNFILISATNIVNVK